MNKFIWIILIAVVAVLVGIVVFSPQPATDTPQVVTVENKKPDTRVTPPPSSTPAPAKTPNAVKPAPSANPSVSKAVPEVEPTPQQQPEREAPTETQFVLCEHIISGVTQYGFSGEIRLINKGKKSVNGWSVTWEYDDGATIVEAQDVALSGNNPYTGEYLDWNAEIKPGETVVFKFNGLKGDEGAPMGVRVTGETCM